MKVKILFFLVFSFWNTQILAQSKKTIDSLRVLLPEIEKNDSLFFLVNSKYFIDYYANTNLDSSIYFIEKSINIAKKNKWLGSEIGLYSSLAFAYNTKGLVFKAIEINYQALMLAEKNKRPELSYPIERVLGESYLSLKQYEKAKDLIFKAYINSIKFKDQFEQFANLTALGNLFLELKELKEAESNYRKALELSSVMNDAHFQGLSYHNLALALSKQNKNEEALLLFDKSLNLHKSENHQYSLGNLKVDISEVLFLENQFKKSIKNAEEALNHGSISNSPEIISKANFLLFKNHKALKNKNLALSFFEKYIALKDSLNQEDFEKRINSLKLEYDNTLKEAQISSQKVELLKKDNENLILHRNRNLFISISLLVILIASFLIFNRLQLKKMNKNLETKIEERTSEIAEANRVLIRKNEEISQALFKGQNIERKRVASELHDNLSSLLSALKMSLSAINTQGFNDSEKHIYKGVQEMMSNAYREVRNISHNILPEELETLGLAGTLQNVFEKINRAGNLKIEFENTTNQRFDTKIEFNLYSVCMELINNIIKHSEASKVKISLSETTNIAELIISDNGKGFSIQEVSGNGLKNVKNRIEAINGTLKIDSKPEAGTQIKIHVPA
ncbi:tetratricopeptide repeat protein [Lacihabitans sp. LS3-19]|uniref:tetratricopeptide repeat-containing sensor histidine kinase n=1 Tax=Lacihabitans sp. LS3-19 TaxID=2487335 RepID=UPI0020CD33B7|nr:tetratricopeptide repeat protein [Lacihabitans sp. LS3-19]